MKCDPNREYILSGKMRTNLLMMKITKCKGTNVMITMPKQLNWYNGNICMTRKTFVKWLIITHVKNCQY